MVAVAEKNVDVKMQNADSPSGDGDVDDIKNDADLLSIQDIREQASQIEKAVQSQEPIFILRVLRSLPNTRRKLNTNVLRGIISWFWDHSATEKAALLAFFEEPMETDAQSSHYVQSGNGSNVPLLPEVAAYIHLLIVLRLIDSQNYYEAVQCSDQLIAKVTAQKKRTLDLIAAKCYYFHSLCYEHTNQLQDIRGFLHSRLRTATLRNDFEGQAVLINCLLRNYLHYRLYDQANKLVSKLVFPEAASINEWARFYYYLGRIRATYLQYSAAHKYLVQAMRKAPQYAAPGFRQTIQKLAVTVELLLGDIPERRVFLQATFRRPLAPYFQLTQAVLVGNLPRFGEILKTFGSQFCSDNTYTLVSRLRHNVIKTAIRRVGLSYSRISPADIALKLGLDSPEDAEFIVVKAIRDGVIEATLDSERGYMCSKETADIYCTREPQIAFRQRMSFCLHLHNQSVRAMRYPSKSYEEDLKAIAERRIREQLDMELAKQMAEEDDEEEEEDGFP